MYIALSTGVRSSLNSDYIEQSLGSRYSVRHTTFILQTIVFTLHLPYIVEYSVIFSNPGGHMSQTGPKKCFIPQNCRKYTNFD